jgi:D-serine deaminase-like pyridoxal phosphate-dependent protein
MTRNKDSRMLGNLFKEPGQMMPGVMPHQSTRASVPTPALVIDLTALERNVAAMAALAAQWGVHLRPHAKSHKCVAIARRQVAAGAVGVSCATLDELAAMVAGGWRGCC